MNYNRYVDLETLLKTKRKALGLTQMQLAVRAGVSLPTIQNLEAKRGNPTILLLEKISAVLGCSVKVVSDEPDWGLLQRAGLPLEMGRGAKEGGAAGAPSTRGLVEHLFRAVDYLMKHPSPETDRFKEATAALIWAIEHYYRMFYLYNLKDPKIDLFLSKNPMRGRILKLMRIAASDLSKVL